MQNNISAALAAKANKSLDTKMRYEEGIMTKREWLKMQMVKGAIVQEGTKNRIDYNRTKFNRMTSNREQEEYMNKCNERVICYELRIPGQNSFWEITKTEYEYFKAAELSSDIMTEKMELTHKIEAGTATDEEIQQDEAREIEFFQPIL